MTKGLDMFGVDWSQISRDWSRLNTAEQAEVQKTIANMYRLSEPFRIVVHRLVEEKCRSRSRSC
jgi:hypothetical protein